MGYFFNVIYGDYDRVNELHYYNGIKKNEDEKFEGIKLVLSNIGINNIRKCTLDSISENPNEIINNNFAWQASNTLPYTLYDEYGESNTTVTPPSFDYGDPSGIPDNETGSTFNSVANTFTCDNMVNLYCYNSYGGNFSVRASDDKCNTNSGGNKTVVRGCYVLVNKPIVSLVLLHLIFHRAHTIVLLHHQHVYLYFL